MAGSGDIHTTQMLRKVRNFKSRLLAVNKDAALHSLHVSANMALGMLYLGHGRCVLLRTL